MHIEKLGIRLKFMNRLLILFVSGSFFFGCEVENNIQNHTENKIKREEVEVITPIFSVIYSETKEQPITLTYKSSNRTKNVDRASMDFFKETEYHTSDDNDYYNNIWDKGHIAPAATFSDSYENLRQTFSFLNCTLQNQHLNRGEWKLLEEQERLWDNDNELVVVVDIEFSDSVLPTGATIPSKFIKHIKFSETELYRCFEFDNEKPYKDWTDYEVQHSH